MAPNTLPTDAPPAHEGAHYANPSSKPISGHQRATNGEGFQRVVWVLFFVLIFGSIAAAVLLGVVRPPH